MTRSASTRAPRARAALGAAVLLALVAVLPACGGETKVGSDDLLAVGDDGGSGRLGAIDATTTTAPAATATTAAPAQPAATAPPQQQAPATTAPPELPPATVAVTAQGYEPFNLRVFAGTELRVTNRDSQARTFTADDGSFDSGPIAPGATWTHRLDTPGTFAVHDETRPFVVGQIEVVPR